MFGAFEGYCFVHDPDYFGIVRSRNDIGHTTHPTMRYLSRKQRHAVP